MWDLLKEFKAYPSWTGGRLKFLPAPTAQGNIFLLLTKIGFLPPAPVPCKVRPHRLALAAWPWVNPAT